MPFIRSCVSACQRMVVPVFRRSSVNCSKPCSKPYSRSTGAAISGNPGNMPLCMQPTPRRPRPGASPGTLDKKKGGGEDVRRIITAIWQSWRPGQGGARWAAARGEGSSKETAPHRGTAAKPTKTHHHNNKTSGKLGWRSAPHSRSKFEVVGGGQPASSAAALPNGERSSSTRRV
jgi:hypothetical protein